MNGIYIGNNKMLIKTVYGGMLTVSADDRSLMPTLVATGAIEMRLTQYFLQAIPPKGTIVDVGTNIGYFTLMAAMIVGDEGKVVGLEANPSVFSNLKENIDMNWMSHRVELLNQGVYSEKTMIEFHASPTHHGDSSIHLRPNATTQNIQIPTITLDEVLSDVPSVDFLKIDIEGGEYHAFKGMKESLASKKIKQISFEWNKLMLGKDAPMLEEILIKLQESGATYFTLNGEGKPEACRVEDITSTDFYPFGVIKM